MKSSKHIDKPINYQPFPITIEYVKGNLRYRFTNVGLKVGDKVFPFANGRCTKDEFILHDIDYRDFMSGFPDDPHIIKDLAYSKHKPEQCHTSHGFGPIEIYFKIIKVERHIEKKIGKFKHYEWIEIEIPKEFKNE